MDYEVKIRFEGHVSWVTVNANNAAQAKRMVENMYPGAYILGARAA